MKWPVPELMKHEHEKPEDLALALSILEALIVKALTTDNVTAARILDAVHKMEKNIMQAIEDFATKVNANFAQVKSGIQALDDQIVAFQNSPGTLSPADQAALDGIVAASAALATAAQAVVPPVPPTA